MEMREVRHTPLQNRERGRMELVRNPVLAAHLCVLTRLRRALPFIAHLLPMRYLASHMSPTRIISLPSSQRLAEVRIAVG
jgi:hypothetical protein